MNSFAGFAPSPTSPTKEPTEPTPSRTPLQEDVDMSSGSSGNEATNENCSTGRDSQGSDCDDSGKELGMLVEPPDAHESPDAFSLMLAKSEHNPSTSGCSSEQSAKADTHKELIKTLKELKVHLPADKKAKGKASTLATLKYALRSVKQVKANEEYYQLLMCSEKPSCGADVPSCSLEDIQSVTSELTVKNADMFAAAVSLVTGKVLYISDQVTSIFHCRRDAFRDAKFVEFLAPHDVSVFHNSTTPYKLPPWSVCSGADSFAQECMEEKSFFCRVSVGKSHENEVRYHPFRMTPYLVQVPEQQGAGGQLCCVLLAERVHSGYEGDGRLGSPRLPWSSGPPVGHAPVYEGTPAQSAPSPGPSLLSLETQHTHLSPSPPGAPPYHLPAQSQSLCADTCHPCPAITMTVGVLRLPQPLPSDHVVTAALTGLAPSPSHSRAPQASAQGPLTPGTPAAPGQNPKPRPLLSGAAQASIRAAPRPILPLPDLPAPADRRPLTPRLRPCCSRSPAPVPARSNPVTAAGVSCQVSFPGPASSSGHLLSPQTQIYVLQGTLLS